MTKKLVFSLIMLILTSFIYGCGIVSEDFVPVKIPLEDSIKQIILSKGENYDFLQDELFISKINEMGLAGNFTMGHLDEDNIPELAVYIERDPQDTNDPGRLEIYKFTGEKYEIIDSINMNFDNSNNIMVIGKISETQNGLLISNEVGAHSAVTYGFILENGKLKDILNSKKIPLISTYADNEIKDIDNDGILEFSIYTIDPETNAQSASESDNLILWYKWDGNDSGEVIMVERPLQYSMDTSVKMFSAEIATSYIDDIPSEPVNISELETSIENLDSFDATDKVRSYIDNLKNPTLRNNELTSILKKYTATSNSDFLNTKSDLSLDRLNDLEYLRREKIMLSEPELKSHLINHLEMGYKVGLSEGEFSYLVDYQMFVNKFGDSILKEYRDYLLIKSRDTNEPYTNNGSLIISRDKIGERIIEMEKFKLRYPYSVYIEDINYDYSAYIRAFLYGTTNSPNYAEGNKYTEGNMAVFNNTINKYPESHLSDILRTFIQELSFNSNILTDEIRTKINNLII